MAGEIERALDLLNQRKASILGDEPDRSIGETDFVMMLSGFDLDPDELIAVGHAAARHGIDMMAAQIQAGGNPDAIIGSALFDGLALGLLIAQAREGEATRVGS